jgi:hypothetical protein
MATILVTGTPGQNISGPGGATNLVLLAGTHGNGKIGPDGTYGYLASTGAVARQIYGSPETPASADYYVETVRTAPNYAFDSRQVAGVRYNADASSGYEVEHHIVNQRINVYRMNAGVPSGVLLTWSGFGDRVRLAVSGTGSTVSLTLTVDGTLRGTFDDTSADRIVTAGVPGCGWAGAASATNTATHGVNIAEWSSDAYAGAPANTPPTVTITSPSAGALSVPAGTKLVLEATATDPQDDDSTLTNSITWRSSDTADGLGGSLGQPGGSVIIDTTGWVNGQRIITANVTDAGGLAAAPDSFTLTIGWGSGGVSPAARFILGALGGY